MKILIIGINYEPELTGCGPYTTDLAQQLMKDGHEVRVITGLPHYPAWKVPQSYRGKLQSTSENDGVLVTRLWHWVPRKYSSLGRVIYEITFGLHSLFRVLPLRADICIVVSPSLLSIFAGIWLKFRSVPLKILVQDLIGPITRYGVKDNVKIISTLTYKLERFLLRQATSIGVVSNSFIQQILNYGIDLGKIQVTENYSLVEFKDLNHSEERIRWGWSHKKTIVLYTGNLGTKQNLSNLIQTAQILDKKESRLHFVIVGDGNEANKLQSLAKGLTNIEFRGLVAQESYPSLLKSADILILHEGTMNEAMSSPSKLEVYLASRRPTFIVCSPQSATFSTVNLFKIPHCDPSNPVKLAQSLDEFQQNLYIADYDPSTSEERLEKRIQWILSS